MPRKPPKTASKRVKRPKAPKPLDLPTPGRLAGSGIGANLPLPAPKTRVVRNTDDPRCSCGKYLEGCWSADFPRNVKTYHGIYACTEMPLKHPPELRLTPSSRWSRLWAWLGRLGRP